jgi:hypothetical protein
VEVMEQKGFLRGECAVRAMLKINLKKYFFSSSTVGSHYGFAKEFRVKFSYNLTIQIARLYTLK